MNKKKLIIGIICIILVMVIMFIIFKDKPKKVTNESNDNNPVASKNYENYTTIDNIPTADSNVYMKLKVVNGSLEATIEDTKLAVTGISDKVKAFNVGYDCAGVTSIIVITEDKRLFVESHAISDGPSGTRFDKSASLNFNEIALAEEVVNITKYPYASKRTCGGPDFAAVLSNGEIRALYLPAGSSDYTNGEFNYDLVKTVVYPVVIYEDTTISDLLDNPYDGPIKDKYEYTGENLYIDKYYQLDTNGSVITSYVISRGNLYELTITRDNNNDTKLTEIKLIDEFLSENIKTNPGLNEYPNKTNNTITFVNGKTFEINGIVSIYDNKEQ